MFGLGPVELIIILLIIVLVFGAGRIAGIGGALGKSIREFKKEATVPVDSGATEATADSKTEATKAAEKA